MRSLSPAGQERERAQQNELNALLVGARAAKEAARAYQAQQQQQSMTPPVPGAGFGGAPATPPSMPLPGAESALRAPVPAGMALGTSGGFAGAQVPLSAQTAPGGTPTAGIGAPPVQPPLPPVVLPPAGGSGLGMRAGIPGGVGALSGIPAPLPPSPSPAALSLPLRPFAAGGVVDAPPSAPTSVPTDPRSLKAAAPVPLLPGVVSAEQILDAIGRALAGEPVDPAAYVDVPGAAGSAGVSGAGVLPEGGPEPGDDDLEARAFLTALRENPPQAPRRFEAWLVNAPPQTDFERDMQETFAQNAGSAGLLYGVARAAAKEADLLGPAVARLVGGAGRNGPLPGTPGAGGAITAPLPRGRVT